MQDNNLDNKIFIKNLKWLRKISGRTQEQLAETLNIPRTKIASWESGRSVPKVVKDYKKIADLFAINLNQLLYTDLSIESNIPKNDIHAISLEPITVYGKVCAGYGIEALENPICSILNPYPGLKGDLFALQVNGDSMNKIAPDKSYAIIKRQPSVENGEIAVVLINGYDGMLKRFNKYPDMIILRPESFDSSYNPLIFEKDEMNQVKILGKFIGAVTPEQ